MRAAFVLSCAAAVAGCAADDPAQTYLDGGAESESESEGEDGGMCPGNTEFPGGGDNPGCDPLAGDYAPGANDDWAPCISDDGEYHPFDENISTIGRVAAFEEIADLLWENAAAPTVQDFIDARLVYAEDQGLESRVSRREDMHYPPAPMECRDLAPEDQAMYPDRCVGQVQMQPLLNDAFAAGAKGEDPRENAARIEATLLWFLYVSVYKEATTCADNAPDCDSSWAYYTGGQAQDGGLGLARYVRAESGQAHGRTWDGLLAVRCWRDLDNPTGVATDLDTRDLARGQLDRALLRGLALVVRTRLAALENACPQDRAPLWAFLEILGPVLDREATERDETEAQALRAELTRENFADVDVAAAIGALDAIFPCP